ncbi:hypothetical protein P8C59_008309 [Phyllachora maydis]|uniref:hydroxymethylbilane synthase n=1 Tax=Phyllachora maydis TaxID=1825666 RepID=A0AAD9MF24_9PEZI|nr:hypothetical protein P8C59_008309 [Phyllachora maydis]
MAVPRPIPIPIVPADPSLNSSKSFNGSDLRPLKIGTRRSPLALRQVDLLLGQLRAVFPQQPFTVQALSVAGDRDKTTPLPALGKSLWTVELDNELLTGGLDLVVHCVKDMPTALPAGLALGAVTAREDPRDVVVFRAAHAARYRTLADLPPGAVVGTSSVRRAAQLRRHYPALVFRDVRGNIDTRLRKVDGTWVGPDMAGAGAGPQPPEPQPEYDCIILAAAGLLRMGLGGRIAQYLDAETPGGGTLHAVGQGALGIEVRAGDARVEALLAALADGPTMLACWAERSLMRTLEGGCSVPIGVETAWLGAGPEEPGKHSDKQQQKKLLLRLRATVVSVDGREGVDAEETREIGSLDEAEDFGRHLAQILVGKGAQTILDAINQDRPASAGAVKLALDQDVLQLA